MHSSLFVRFISDNEEHIICGLYYKHITIVNDDSRVVSWWLRSLFDDALVVIYDCNVFITQATGANDIKRLSVIIMWLTRLV
jgi:hypothetical protein